MRETSAPHAVLKASTSPYLAAVGAPAIPGGNPATLIRARPSTNGMPSGIILSTYKVAGPLKTG